MILHRPIPYCSKEWLVCNVKLFSDVPSVGLNHEDTVLVSSVADNGEVKHEESGCVDLPVAGSAACSGDGQQSSDDEKTVLSYSRFHGFFSIEQLQHCRS